MNSDCSHQHCGLNTLKTQDGAKCLSGIHSCSVNGRHHLIKFKVVHRLHYSKARVYTMYPSVSPVCVRCNISEGTQSQAFWSCTLLTGFWSKIFDWYTNTYGMMIHPEPGFVNFGCTRTINTGTIWQPLKL